MLFSFPLLVIGWLLALKGIYYFGASLFDYPINEENASLAAIWTFIFSYGFISIAGMLASIAEFASSTNVRKIYKYSIITGAVLFLGCSIIGPLVWGVISVIIG
jgi:hypothetical protein